MASEVIQSTDTSFRGYTWWGDAAGFEDLAGPQQPAARRDPGLLRHALPQDHRPEPALHEHHQLPGPHLRRAGAGTPAG